MLKQTITLVLLNLCFFNSKAQKQSNWNVKVETGIFWDFLDNRIFVSGPFVNIEPQLRATKNTTIGFRMGAALSTQSILSSDEFLFHIDNSIGSIGIFSLVPTFNYYFNSKLRNPYVGVGLGYYSLRTSKKGFLVQKPFDAIDLNIDNQFGLLVRTGVDCRNFILGLEFNYIPKADVLATDQQKMGTVQTTYLALSIARTIGNRSKRKQ